MANKILMVYAAADALFLIMGIILLGFSIVVQNTMTEGFTDGEQAARNLMYRKFPLNAAIGNAILVIITFLTTVPALFMKTRRLLVISGYMVTVCAIYTLVIGISLWILTLTTKNEFFQIWVSQPSQVQELWQTSFKCCGYFNSTSPAFITNPTCPSPAAAAMMRGCSSPITSFVNILINDLFTAVFGMVGADVILILATTCLLKDRKERERYRHIDEKSGIRGL